MVSNDCSTPSKILNGEFSRDFGEVLPASRINGGEPGTVRALMYQRGEGEGTETDRQPFPHMNQRPFGQREIAMCKASGDDCLEDTILVASHQIPGDEAPQGCGEERKLSIPQMIRQCDHTVREIGCIQTKTTSSMSADAGILGYDTLKITFQEVCQKGEVIDRAAHSIDEIEGRAVAPDPKVNRARSVFNCLKRDLLSKFTENDLP